MKKNESIKNYLICALAFVLVMIPMALSMWGGTILDEVSYENLIPGKEYRVKGVVIDKNTGDLVRDSKGNAIEAVTVFTPDASSGTVIVRFTFKGGFSRGQIVVITCIVVAMVSSIVILKKG